MIGVLITFGKHQVLGTLYLSNLEGVLTSILRLKNMEAVIEVKLNVLEEVIEVSQIHLIILQKLKVSLAGLQLLLNLVK